MKKLMMALVAVVAMAATMIGCGGSGSSGGGGVTPPPPPVDTDVFFNTAVINVDPLAFQSEPRGNYPGLALGQVEYSAEKPSPKTGLARLTFLVARSGDVSVNNHALIAAKYDDAGIEPDEIVPLVYDEVDVLPLGINPETGLTEEVITFDFVVDDAESFVKARAGKTVVFSLAADVAIGVAGPDAKLRASLMSDEAMFGDETPDFYAALVDADAMMVWTDGYEVEGPVLEAERFGNGYDAIADTETGHLAEVTRMATYRFTDETGGPNPYDPFITKPIVILNEDLGGDMIIGGILVPGLEKDAPLQRMALASAAEDSTVSLGHLTYEILVSKRDNKDETFQFVEGYIQVDLSGGGQATFDDSFIEVVEVTPVVDDGYDHFIVLVDFAGHVPMELLTANDAGGLVTLVANVKAPGIASVKDAFLSIRMLGDAEAPANRPSDYTGVASSNFAWSDDRETDPALVLSTEQWSNAADVIEPFVESDWVTYQYRPEHGDIVVTRDAPPTN